MQKRKWVLTGGDTLAGQEVRDYIEEHHLPVVLLTTSSQPDDRVLTEKEGELAVLEPLDETTLEGAEAVLLAASEQVNERARTLAAALNPRPVLIDLTGQYEQDPEARLRAPGAEAAPMGLAGAIEIVAHPAAVALAKLLRSVQALAPMRAVVVNVFEPVSSRGKAAMDELHQQTVSLFNFAQQPRQVFDAQASFNLLPRFGDHAPPPSLDSVELRIEQHLASLLGPALMPAVSLRVLHAPVFHGHCQSVWIEFEQRPDTGAIESHLKGAGVDVRYRRDEPASNVAAVGQSGIMVSDIAPDRANARAIWIWLASDNLRTLAETAVLLAGLSHREDA